MQSQGLKSSRYADFLKGIEEALPALRSFARSLTCNRMAADDLVQATCERALERAEQVTNMGGLKSWLNRIVYTQWQDTIRKQKTQQLNAVHIEVCSFGKKGSEEERSIAKLDVEKALHLLSPEHRAAVVLITVFGYGYDEAAELLDIPPGTVASRVARGRALLAQYLNKAGKHEKQKQQGGGHGQNR